MGTMYGNPYTMDRDEFETDVFRIVDMMYDDLRIEVQVETGDKGGFYVEVLAVRDDTGTPLFPPIATPQTFYSVDSFRAFVDTFAPEEYR